MDQPKIERVLRLIKLMTGNINYTIEELADKLDTSYRSIYRYIDTFKNAGFVVHKLDGGVYKLGKESRHFKDISQLIHFTEEEAYIFNQMLEGLDENNTLKNNLRHKLSSVYDCTSMAKSTISQKNATNINHLREAIQEGKQVILRQYSSSHGSDIRDRHVEPFAFTTNYIQVWCYDPQDKANKLFKTSRIGSVEILPDGWVHTEEHSQGYVDIFRINGNSQYLITLKLGVLSHNLLLEEYPLAEQHLTRADETHWLLKTNVCSYTGVGRFVIGLAQDIEIIETPGLEKYLQDYAAKWVVK